MLHTKSQGNGPSGSGEVYFLRVFTIHGRGSHLGNVTRTIWTNFCSPILRSLHMKFEFYWPSGFRGEDVWKCWQATDRRTDDGVIRLLIAYFWAYGSGELIKACQACIMLARLSHLGHCSNKLIRRICWTVIFSFWPLGVGGGGGQINPLMHVALYHFFK